jgi:hypothetical protein
MGNDVRMCRCADFGCADEEGKLKLPSLPLAEERVVERSDDRVSKFYARHSH